MRNVLVTGASSGIGAATARSLAENGCGVFAGVRTEGDARRIQTSLSPSVVEPLVFDVTDPESIRRAADGLRDSTALLDGLVNNAGIAVPGPLEALDPADLRHQLEVNVVGQLAVTQAFLPALRAAVGRVVFVGSIAGKAAVPYAGAYNASKYALEGLADALRQELSEAGVAVSLIEPGVVDTPIWHKALDRLRNLAPTLEGPVLADHRDGLADFEHRLEQAPERGLEPEKVADVILEALTTERPDSRYPVGAGARLLARVKPLIPDRVYDAVTVRGL
jgi:NAD(P)-dependent dehydrogenase (short-subunit alcohol dehydrogenase family)